MTAAQKQAAIKAALENITRQIESAPDYGSVSVSLVLHGGEVTRITQTIEVSVKAGGAV